ncbi:MAG TPA: hypothetical protein VGB32_02135 [Candidatus Bathyarchaeia archaeon]
MPQQVTIAMELETEIKEIKSLLASLNQKLDALLAERETHAIMQLTENSLKEFLDEEPDLYTREDLKVRYS